MFFIYLKNNEIIKHLKPFYYKRFEGSKMIDQRNAKRFKTLWKIYLKINKKYELAGYLMDISQGGARFFLDKIEGFDLTIGKTMLLMVKTQGANPQEKELSFEVSWVKEWKDSESPFEVGVRFTKPSKSEEEDIKSLIEKFDKK